MPKIKFIGRYIDCHCEVVFEDNVIVNTPTQLLNEEDTIKWEKEVKKWVSCSGNLMKLKTWVKNSEKVDDLLRRLDKVAREYNGYEYCLPIGLDETRAQLRGQVCQWMVESEKKR